MKIVLLNWTGGENDPFSPFNELLAKKFKAIGRDASIVNLDSNFDKHFAAELDQGVDFVLCWQGIGSRLSNLNSKKPIWDELRIPLICLHGDHPCHNLSNHLAESRFISHFYGSASFARYANSHLARETPAYTMFFPNFFQNAGATPRARQGNHFVFPKNLDDTQAMLESWKEKYPRNIYASLHEIIDAIGKAFKDGISLDHHRVTDQFIDQPFLNLLGGFFNNEDEKSLRNFVHAITDKYYRNFASQHVLLELPDVRIKIFGRGWDRFKRLNNKNHEFGPAPNLVDADFQYHSNYGIIDIAPIYDSLHDRTLKAAALETGFLIASSWDFSENLGQNFSNLFFSGVKNDLREKTEMVIRNPDSHRQHASNFARSYNQTFSFYRFAKDLELTSRITKVQNN